MYMFSMCEVDGLMQQLWSIYTTTVTSDLQRLTKVLVTVGVKVTCVMLVNSVRDRA